MSVVEDWSGVIFIMSGLEFFLIVNVVDMVFEL